MKRVVLLLLLIAAGWVGAATGSEARRAQLEAAVNRVQQEQQSVYQQFQMVLELRRQAMQEAYQPSPPGAPASVATSMESLPPVNYDENIRQQRERQERSQQSARDLNALYARYVELGEQRKALVDQIARLAAP